MIIKGRDRGGSNRVIRGGSWNNNARNLRCANRSNNGPSNRNNNLGFRLRQHNLQFLPEVKWLRLFCPCIKLSNVPFLLLPVQNKEYGGRWAPFFWWNNQPAFL
jgi:hypothetical protein